MGCFLGFYCMSCIWISTAFYEAVRWKWLSLFKGVLQPTHTPPCTHWVLWIIIPCLELDRCIEPHPPYFSVLVWCCKVLLCEDVWRWRVTLKDAASLGMGNDLYILHSWSRRVIALLHALKALLEKSALGAELNTSRWCSLTWALWWRQRRHTAFRVVIHAV